MTAELTTLHGRELDFAVAERLFGWKRFDRHPYGWSWIERGDIPPHRDTNPERYESSAYPPQYSADANATMLVLARLRELGWLITLRIGQGRVRCILDQFKPVFRTCWGKGDTLPLAVCGAALACASEEGQV